MANPDAEKTNRAVPSANVDAAQLYALLSAGYEPLGCVVGMDVQSMGTRGMARSLRGLFKKGEMPAVAETATLARQRAIEKCEKAAAELGADMVLITQFEVRDVAEVVEVSCTGTALKKSGSFKPMPIATATN